LPVAWEIVEIGIVVGIAEVSLAVHRTFFAILSIIIGVGIAAKCKAGHLLTKIELINYKSQQIEPLKGKYLLF